MMEAISAFALGGALASTVAVVIVSEINRQWRREFHKQRLETDAMLSEIWAAVTDPGENYGGPVEGVQVGVGEFYHLKDADLLDPRDVSANLNSPIPAQERTNTNG